MSNMRRFPLNQIQFSEMRVALQESHSAAPGSPLQAQPQSKRVQTHSSRDIRMNNDRVNILRGIEPEFSNTPAQSSLDGQEVGVQSHYPIGANEGFPDVTGLTEWGSKVLEKSFKSSTFKKLRTGGNEQAYIALKKFLANDAYDIYSRRDISPNITKTEKKELFKCLSNLEKAGFVVESQREYGTFRQKRRGVSELLNRDPGEAEKTHYFVYSKKQKDIQFGVCARASFGTSSATAAKLIRCVSLLYENFGKSIYRFKVTSPRRQGTRPDGLIVFLKEPDIDMKISKAISTLLVHELPEAEWLEEPAGMAKLNNEESDLVGSYGEVFGGKSFGDIRSAIIAKTIINCLKNYGADEGRCRESFEGELKKTIMKFGYDCDNPAFILRLPAQSAH